MFKKCFFVVLCGILLVGNRGDAKTYPKEDAMQALAMGLVMHLSSKVDLKNAAVGAYIERCLGQLKLYFCQRN